MSPKTTAWKQSGSRTENNKSTQRSERSGIAGLATSEFFAHWGGVILTLSSLSLNQSRDKTYARQALTLRTKGVFSSTP